MNKRRTCHSTDMVTTVADEWFDHGVSAFQAPDFAKTGLSLVIRRGKLSGPLEVFVERDLEEARRSHARYELTGRSRTKIAGLDVDRVELRWSHSSGDFTQSAVYGSAVAGRWFKMVVSARSEHAPAAKNLLELVLANARRLEGAS